MRISGMICGWVVCVWEAGVRARRRFGADAATCRLKHAPVAALSSSLSLTLYAAQKLAALIIMTTPVPRMMAAGGGLLPCPKSDSARGAAAGVRRRRPRGADARRVSVVARMVVACVCACVLAWQKTRARKESDKCVTTRDARVVSLSATLCRLWGGMASVERAVAHAAARGSGATAPPSRPTPGPAAAPPRVDDDDDAPPPRPRAVGILRLEVYVPRRYVSVVVVLGRWRRRTMLRKKSTFFVSPLTPPPPTNHPHQVDQADLEAYDGAPVGKYTTGLGQRALAFCGDGEDAVSFGLTALDGLLTKARVPPSTIGALYVGTESSPDRAKSVKSSLMRLLAEKEAGVSGGDDTPAPPAARVEGADLVSACYAGTAALMAAVHWVQSEAWDGRYVSLFLVCFGQSKRDRDAALTPTHPSLHQAVVVATDIAVYAAGPARPAGGCGAVALLVGPDAPLPLERSIAATWAADVWDFYKPAGLWPVVVGRVSVDTYLAGLDATYAGVMAALDAKKQKARKTASSTAPPPSCLATDVDYVVMHAPYGKLLRKGFARLAPSDSARAAAAAVGAPPPPPGPGPDYEEKAAVAESAPSFDAIVGPSAWLAAAAGNMYAASLFGGLAALVESIGPSLAGKRILLYSYGSGASARLYSIVPRAGSGQFTLAAAASSLGLRSTLAARVRAPPSALAAALAAAEARHCAADYVPDDGRSAVARGVWRLVRVDEAHRREYAKRPADDDSESEVEAGGGGAEGRVRVHDGVDVEDVVAAG